jgi:hypothetical protein
MFWIMNEYLNTYSDHLHLGQSMSQVTSDICFPQTRLPESPAYLHMPTLAQNFIFVEPRQQIQYVPNEPDLSNQISTQQDSASSLFGTMSQYSPSSPTHASHTEALRQYHEAMASMRNVESSPTIATSPNLWSDKSTPDQNQGNNNSCGHPSLFYVNDSTLKSIHHSPALMHRSLSPECLPQTENYTPIPTYRLPHSPPTNHMQYPQFSHSGGLLSERATTSVPGSPFSSAHGSPRMDLIRPAGAGENSPYAEWLFVCLKEARDHQMILRDIYEWAKHRIPKVKEALINDPSEKGWQNSIRHNLSMNQVSLILLPSCSSVNRGRHSSKLISTPPMMARRSQPGVSPQKLSKTAASSPPLVIAKNPQPRVAVIVFALVVSLARDTLSLRILVRMIKRMNLCSALDPSPLIHLACLLHFSHTLSQIARARMKSCIQMERFLGLQC